jgi:hypothetical protein
LGFKTTATGTMPAGGKKRLVQWEKAGGAGIPEKWRGWGVEPGAILAGLPVGSRL